MDLQTETRRLVAINIDPAYQALCVLRVILQTPLGLSSYMRRLLTDPQRSMGDAGLGSIGWIVCNHQGIALFGGGRIVIGFDYTVAGSMINGNVAGGNDLPSLLAFMREYAPLALATRDEAGALTGGASW